MKIVNQKEIISAVENLMVARTKKSIRLHLRILASKMGYTSVVAEETKVAEIKDWTEEIGTKFLFNEALRTQVR